MKEFLSQIEQNIAKMSSRRRFVGKMGKVVAVLAALTTGQFLENKNTAYAEDTKTKLHCCDGTLCPDHHTKICPNNAIPLYTWSCLDSSKDHHKDHHNYICTDCFSLIETTPYMIYKYMCTFALHVHTERTNQSAKADIVLE